jgi:hypothetical protein
LYEKEEATLVAVIKRETNREIDRKQAARKIEFSLPPMVQFSSGNYICIRWRFGLSKGNPEERIPINMII